MLLIAFNIVVRHKDTRRCLPRCYSTIEKFSNINSNRIVIGVFMGVFMGVVIKTPTQKRDFSNSTNAIGVFVKWKKRDFIACTSFIFLTFNVSL